MIFQHIPNSLEYVELSMQLHAHHFTSIGLNYPDNLSFYQPWLQISHLYNTYLVSCACLYWKNHWIASRILSNNGRG